MNLLIAFLLGLLQGITEFLPLSSSGHMALLGLLTGTEENVLALSVFLHLGTLIALILYFHKDISRLIMETGGLVKDLLYNYGRYRESRRTGKEVSYHKLIRTNYRKMAVMILLAIPPMALMGQLMGGFAELAYGSALLIGAFFLITALVLIVTEFITPGNLIPKDIPLWYSVLIGLLQGVSVLPGISMTALSLAVSSFFGFNRKNAVRFAWLLSIPAIFGAFVRELYVLIAGGGLQTNLVLMAIIGTVTSCVTGYITVRYFLKVLRRIKFTGLAVYSILIGAAAMAVYFVY